MKRQHTANFKAQVVQALLKEDKTIAQIAAEYEVHPTQLRRWKAIVVEGMPSLFEEKDSIVAMRAEYEERLNGLYGDIGRLTTQLTWLKKNLVLNLSRDERLRLVERESEELSVRTQVELLSVNRSGVYYQPQPPSPAEVQLKHRIDEIYTQWPFYGSRKMTAQLQLEGVEVNRKAVQRHMREMGIEGISPGPNLSKRTQKEGIFPYLLRHTASQYPNHVWGFDMTYIRLRSSWMYLVAVLDWYSRYVVSWLRHEVASVAVEAEKKKRDSTWCSTTSTLSRPASGAIPRWEALGTMYPLSSKSDGTVKGHRNCEHQCS